MSLFNIDFDNEALEHYQEVLNGITCDIHKEQPLYERGDDSIDITTCCEKFRKKIDAILDNIDNHED